MERLEMESVTDYEVWNGKWLHITFLNLVEERWHSTYESVIINCGGIATSQQ
ncbi:hypothetical protein HYH96_17345 [Clostridium botulinum]|uniref:hypothetical protein n=1 Tax=Clostridium botulinum TaxID=1491 RepID=UPI00174E725C|nr:hypothetical protein [Clostridium botulinum]MBD5631156.1 hypothetical protein [Clostridium botulinum]MBD5645638.1 hypothetical protein [Clostridium botulinum]